MLKNVVLFFTIAIALTFLSRVNAQGISNWMDKQQVFVEYQKAVGKNRSYYLSEGREKEADLNLGIHSQKKWLYNKTKINSIIATDQFAHVGLESELGVGKSGVEIYFKHFSGHSLDTSYGKDFPQDNSIGIRLVIIEK